MKAHLWMRATMPYTISFEEAAKFAPQIRAILMTYPQVTEVGSELARPDDGTDPTGFFNCEFYVGLRPYNDKTWGQGGIHNKAELTEDLQKKVSGYPGVIFNFTQPAEDAVDEALTGLKSALAVKIYGDDLQVLEDKAVEIKRVLQQVPGFTELTVVRELGQPTVQIDVDREKIARYGINVSDVEGVIQAGVGGQAATQVIQGEQLFDLVVRMKPEYRSSTHDIGDLLVPTPSGQQVPISELANIIRATARRSSIARTIRAISACSSASKAATWLARWVTRKRRCGNPSCCRRATLSIGPANTANTSRRASSWPSSGRWPLC